MPTQVLLVNSDVVLAPDAIDYLLDALDADPKLGIAAPLLLSREEPGWIASAGISYSRADRADAPAGVRAAGRGARPSSLAGIESVSGCVMLIRRRSSSSTGLLDEEYFFSFEDIDFCLRAADKGIPLGVRRGGSRVSRGSEHNRQAVAKARVLRDPQSPETPVAPGRPGRRAIGAAAVLGLNAAHVLISPEVRLPAGLAALARGAWHHFRGRYGSD